MTFRVPTANCPASGKYGSSIWAGVGGNHFTNDQLDDLLVQTGVSVNCLNGQASYYGWRELVPGDGEIKVGGVVKPGDFIAAGVQIEKNEQAFHLADYGSNRQNFFYGPDDEEWNADSDTQVAAPARGYTGECVVERPNDPTVGQLKNLTPTTQISTVGGTSESCAVWVPTANNSSAVSTDPVTGDPSNLPYKLKDFQLVMLNSANQPLDRVSAPNASGVFSVIWARSS